MKRYIWILIVVMFATPLAAQQIPLYSQYFLNPFLYNPARTGQREGLNLDLIYRKMWTDIPGSPQTAAVTLDGSLVSNKVGLGGYVYQDNEGIVGRTAGYLSYAYHIKLADDMHLSLGISGGLVQTRINWAQAVAGDNIVDPVEGANKGTQTGIAFDASAGINYQYKGLNVGFSVPQLVQSVSKDLATSTPLGYELGRTYLLNASYEIPIRDSLLFIEPAMLFRAINAKDYQIDIGSDLMYKRIVWVSLMYRYDYAVTVGAGVRVFDRLTIGYSYDIDVNGLKGYGGGTHEIVIGVRFGRKHDEGIYEQIKQLQQTQKDHGDRIEMLEKRTDTLSNKVNNVKLQNDSIQQQLHDQNINIKELEQKVNDIIRKLANDDSTKTGSKQIDLPSDLVYRGSKEDLDFIMGKPDANYFMVVSSMRTEAMARKVAQGLIDKGNKAGVVYNKKRKWYYIFLSKPGDLEQGIKELYQIRKETQYKDAWIHIYE